MKTIDGARIAALAKEHQTPFYLYDAAEIRTRIAELRQFDVIRYAQKASSNLHLLRLMKSEGVLVDAVSAGELERALRVGYTPEGEPAGVIYTADIASDDTLDRLAELRVPLNAGSPDLLEQIGRRSRGHPVWLRINPGFGHGHSRKTNTGGKWSKHGIWHEHVDEALRHVEKYDLDLVGLHMHIGSGTDFEHLGRVCSAMVEQVRRTGADIRAVSGGGGLPIPYRSDDERIQIGQLYAIWHTAREQIQDLLGHAVQLEIEPGRYLVGESGVLVAEVRAVKRTPAGRFVLIDAGFDNLVRPAMYGSWHEVTVLHADGTLTEGATEPTVLAGPLCESGDVFTQTEGGIVTPRELRACAVGDLVVLHDAGAYASSMASNYNSRPLAVELLADGDETRLIRRRQTIDELLDLEE